MELFEKINDPSFEQMLRNSTRLMVLDHVVSPRNIALLFRLASGFGLDGLILANPVTDPQSRMIRRSSGRRSLSMPCVIVNESWPDQVLSRIKANGYTVFGTALRKETLELGKDSLPAFEKMVLIMGNEHYGLSDHIIDACDVTIKIPMSPGVDSLNVCSAAAIVLDELLRDKMLHG